MKQYDDSPEKASQVARDAIPLASRLGLPVNPHIYAVCYQYASKINPELSTAFDELIQKQPKPERFLVELLYQQYIVEQEVRALELLSNTIESLMSSTQGALQVAGDQTQAYSESLNNAADQLGEMEQAPELLKDLVKRIIDDTQTMASSTCKLQDQLEGAKAEVSKLQEDYYRIKEESLTDALTGLKNRRAFDDAFEEHTAEAKEQGQDLCLLILDADHFKKVNDTFGHGIGDSVLRVIAKVIKTLVRGNDFTARFGGEEFIILLPETPLEGAMKVAEKIRQVIASQNLKHNDQNLGSITVSLGVALFDYNESKEQFFERADAALYSAKDSGRNRVVASKA